MSSYVIDQSRYPLVVIRMSRRATSDAIDAWYDEVEALLGAATGKVALIHDMRFVDLSAITAAHRSAVAARTNRLRELGLGEHIGADARIAPNAIVAGAIRAVSWLTGAVPWPQGTFTSEDEALAWSEQQLQEGARPRR